MATKYRKPCFDTSVFLGKFNEEIINGIKRHVVVDYLWEKAKAKEFPVLISTFVIVETFKKRGRVTPPDTALDEFLNFINEDFVQVIELDRETALNAHQLCRRFASNGLRPVDAVHLACAISAHCDVLLAWNGPLNTISLPEIKIEEPQIYDRTLFTGSECATPEEVSRYEAKRNLQGGTLQK